MRYFNNLYYRIIVSTIYTIRSSGKFQDSWKSVTVFFMTITLMLNLLSLWMLLEEFLFPGFTSFLAFEPFESDYSNRLTYVTLYFFLPLLSVNYLLIPRNEELILALENKYPSSRSKKLFGIHFFGSYVIALICLGIVTFMHNEG